MISVVIPTIKGRERYLENCVEAYEKNTVNPVQLIVVHDKPAVGIAWNEGMGLATGEYIHLTADDLEPHEGWDEPAIECVDLGYMPAPRIVDISGAVVYCGMHGNEEFPDWVIVPDNVIPFMSMEMWKKVGPSLPIHYYSDTWLAWKAQKLGIKQVLRNGFCFTHSYAQIGRGAGMSEAERMMTDKIAYEYAQKDYGINWRWTYDQH